MDNTQRRSKERIVPDEEVRAVMAEHGMDFIQALNHIRSADIVRAMHERGIWQDRRLVDSFKDLTGICPSCKGKKYVNRFLDNTLSPCLNCGGQGMNGTPTGRVPLRPDGRPCWHLYGETNVGNCLHKYTCQHCQHSYVIDSSD